MQALDGVDPGSQVLSEDWESSFQVRNLCDLFPKGKYSFYQESKALAGRTAPIPGGGAEGKGRNLP